MARINAISGAGTELATARSMGRKFLQHFTIICGIVGATAATRIWASPPFFGRFTCRGILKSGERTSPATELAQALIEARMRSRAENNDVFFNLNWPRLTNLLEKTAGLAPEEFEPVLNEVRKHYASAQKKGSVPGLVEAYDLVLKFHLEEAREFKHSAQAFGPTSAYRMFLAHSAQFHSQESMFVRSTYLRTLANEIQTALTKWSNPAIKPFVIIGGSWANGRALESTPIEGLSYPSGLWQNPAVKNYIESADHQVVSLALKTMTSAKYVGFLFGKNQELTWDFPTPFNKQSSFALEIRPKEIWLHHFPAHKNYFGPGSRIPHQAYLLTW